jgi:hypothetical protein
MIEWLDLPRIIEIADLPEVKACFYGKSLEERLRGLAECRAGIDGPETSLFRFRMLDQWEVVLPSLDYPGPFLWDVFDEVFAELGAGSLFLSSSSREVGDQFRAVFLGHSFGTFSCKWRLDRAEFAQAVRPVRTEERGVELPPRPNGNRFRKPRKAAQAEA